MDTAGGEWSWWRRRCCPSCCCCGGGGGGDVGGWGGGVERDAGSARGDSLLIYVREGAGSRAGREREGTTLTEKERLGSGKVEENND